jgi:serine/threonine-protein kinase
MPRRAPILLLLAALIALALGAGPARAQGIYAALAISPSTGAYGYGYNYDTSQGAQDRAMAECRKYAQDCRVYSTFSRACIAVARASNNAFGWAIGYADDERPERALNQCAYRNGGDCRVVVRFCSGTTGR